MRRRPRRRNSISVLHRSISFEMISSRTNKSLLNAYRELKRLGTDALAFAHDERTTPDELIRYVEMRLRGESHKMAEVLATRKFPGLKGTDAIFWEGWFSGDAGRNHHEQLWLRQ